MSEWTEDAPEFTEDEKRDQAESIVRASLRENALEAIEYYARNDSDFDNNIHDVGLMIRNNEHFFNKLVSVCLDKDREQIQQELEQND